MKKAANVVLLVLGMIFSAWCGITIVRPILSVYFPWGEPRIRYDYRGYLEKEKYLQGITALGEFTFRGLSTIDYDTNLEEWRSQWNYVPNDGRDKNWYYHREWIRSFVTGESIQISTHLYVNGTYTIALFKLNGEDRLNDLGKDSELLNRAKQIIELSRNKFAKTKKQLGN